MKSLDTNVLVRYLTQDDAAQARRANALIEAAAASRERLFIGPVVLCELVWVLRGAYGLKRTETVDVLERVLDTAQFEIGDGELARRAVNDYRAGPGDFADYVIGHRAKAAGAERTVTFDRSLRRSPLFSVLQG